MRVHSPLLPAFLIAFSTGARAADPAPVQVVILGTVHMSDSGLLNEPARVAGGHGFYRTMLRSGSAAARPGVALVPAGSRRNLALCARRGQAVRAGDRVVVLYGWGQAQLLRQCVDEMPGWK